MDEVLASVAETIKNFAVIYLVDITEVTTIRLIGLSETNKSSLISLKLSSMVQGKDVVLSSLPKITLPNTATNFVLTYEPQTQKTRYETNTDMSNTGHAFNLKCWCYISKLWILLLYHLSCDSKNVPNSFSLYHVTTFVLQKLNYYTVGQRDVCLLLP
ncbi:putative Dim1 family, thioredoxin-like protein [Medicago truncatula]|uniref:Putative Dim1 family, thioredoxin-like protein n=1 Tax=Medicago truncatula TaxID=3880 RepID=A0A396ID00_MEDTR|nr:putative Dim1 family, thioredoxin-like protein [Medicago truncatula]